MRRDRAGNSLASAQGKPAPAVSAVAAAPAASSDATQRHHVAGDLGERRQAVGRPTLHELRTLGDQIGAAIVANIRDGTFAYVPTQTELAKAAGVSVQMVQRAKRLSPLARQFVMSGKATLGFFAKPAAPKPVLKMLMGSRKATQ